MTIPHRILIVDDDPDVSRMMRVAFQGEDYEILAASSGQEGLERIISDKPEILILDIYMPEMDGCEVLERLRRDEATTSIPVVMLTAQDAEKDILKCQQMGALFYCIKPFLPQELADLIKRILDRSE